MRFKRLRSKIDELRDITSSWRDGEAVSSLEMDMALERVKQIYELLRFESAEEEVAEEVAEIPEVAEPVVDTHGVAAVVDEVIEQIIEEEIAEEEAAEEENAEEMVEQIIEEIIEDNSVALEVEKVSTLNKRERYNRIRSLYDDEPTESEDENEGESETTAETEYVIENEADEVVEPEIVAPQPEVEVEVEVKVVEPEPEPLPEPKPEPLLQPQTTRPSMVAGLTLNDKFLLLNDLFNSDMDALLESIGELDKQPSYEDAIIYIAENYAWDGGSAGAQIMIGLLKNRFEIE